MPKPTGYSTLQVSLHWIIVVLITLQMLLNDAIEDAFDARLDGEAVEAGDGAGALAHVAIGITILVLALIRIAVRLRRGAPPVPPEHNPALRFLASATHFLLYGFLIVQPLSGASAWFLGIEAPAEVHEFLAWYIFLPVVVLHIAGALAEHFVFRTNVLKRMLTPQRD